MRRPSRARRMPAAVRRPARSDDGAAAVEMAIVLPLLLMILFGIIDLGRLMQQQIQLTEAAREGARVGALTGTATEVKATISSVVGAGTTLTYTGGTPTLCAANSAVTADSLVTVQRTFVPATPLLGILQLVGGSSIGTITIHATGAMSCVG